MLPPALALAPPPAGSRSASNGLSDPPVTSDNVVTSGQGAGGSPIPHYSVVDAGPSFTVTCSPSASGHPGSTSTVSYSVSATPLTLTFSGVVNPQTDKRLLIGQRLTATVSGVPGGTGNTYSWGIGGGPFTSYTPSTPASQFVPYSPPSPPTSATTSCCFGSPGSKSVQCTVYIASLGLTATLSDQVTAVAPDFQAWADQGQAELVNGMHLWGAIYRDPGDDPHDGGIFFVGWVQTPADFRGGTSGTNYGTWDFTQLVTQASSWYELLNGDYWDWGGNLSGVTKLDGGYPYGGGTFPANRSEYFVSDEPGMGLGQGMVEAFFASSHQMYLDYTPPGAGSQLVSLQNFTWAWQGHTNSDGSGLFTPPTHSEFWAYGSTYPSQPMWTSVASGSEPYYKRP